MTAQFQTVSVNKTVYQTFLRRMRYKTAQDYRLPFVFFRDCAILCDTAESKWNFINPNKLEFHRGQKSLLLNFWHFVRVLKSRFQSEIRFSIYIITTNNFFSIRSDT